MIVKEEFYVPETFLVLRRKGNRRPADMAFPRRQPIRPEMARRFTRTETRKFQRVYLFQIMKSNY